MCIVSEACNIVFVIYRSDLMFCFIISMLLIGQETSIKVYNVVLSIFSLRGRLIGTSACFLIVNDDGRLNSLIGSKYLYQNEASLWLMA